jgi:putative DNA primase/helicase
MSGHLRKTAQAIEPPPATRRFMLTDTGNGERFAHLFAGRVKFVKAWGAWLVWTGARWQKDGTGEVDRLGKEAVRSVYIEASKEEDADARAKLATWAKASEHANRRAAMLTLARSEPGIAIAPEDLDRDGWLFNTITGTIDMRTGKLRPHDPRDLITKMSPVEYDPDATCPNYDAFIRRITAGSDPLIEYVERFLGYSLTGDIRHHHLPIAWGDGANGKSTLFDLALYTFSDYAAPAPDSLITARVHDEHATETAGLQGLRLVIGSESEEGKKLRIGQIKKLTGDAVLTGRFMRGDYFNFSRTHKMILVTNCRPRVSEDSTAVWRRLRLIPFTVTIPTAEQDKSLPDKLRAEAPGILARWVRACLRWQAAGFDLAEPQAVTTATEDYRGNEDVLADFLASSCIIGDGYRATRRDVWQAYQQWAERRRIPHPLAMHGLYERLRRVEGVVEAKIGEQSERGFSGIGIALGGVQP